MTRYRRELDAYAEQTETTERDMAIARARWEASRLERLQRGDRSWGFPARIGLAGALVAMVAALFFQLSPGGVDPRQPLALGEGGEAVDLELREGIHISGDGRGVLRGAAAARRVALESGALRFEVTPDAGLSLAVETGEGTVQVVGTVFEVSRDALGTAISVERGKVKVACANGGTALVTGGGEALCRSALGYLERGKAARSEGPEAVLAALEGSAALEAEPAVRVALDKLWVSSLNLSGRHAEALAGAEAWLGDPARAAAFPADAVEMRRLAARSAISAGGCERAMPWLESLRGAGAEGVDLFSYGTCLSRTDPAAARAVFEEALAAGLEPALEARVKDLLGR